MIPAQAVEAAAKAIFEEVFAPNIWVEEDEIYKNQFRDSMRRALDAAAPHMQAQAWEEGYTLGYADCANKQESNRPNPYMLNTEGEK